MKKTGMRISALLTALMMLLSIVPALAEAPAAHEAPIAFQNLLEGKTIETDVSIALNPMVGNLLSDFSGAESDEASMAMFNTVINAINKLKANFVANEGAVSGFVGTDLGNLLDFQVDFNPQTNANHITSSILPGLALIVDPEMMKQITQTGAQQISPEEVQQLVH